MTVPEQLLEIAEALKAQADKLAVQANHAWARSHSGSGPDLDRVHVDVSKAAGKLGDIARDLQRGGFE